MADIKDSLERINRINFYNEQILNLARNDLASSAVMSAAAAMEAITDPLGDFQANIQRTLNSVADAITSDYLQAANLNIFNSAAELAKQLSQYHMESTTRILQGAQIMLKDLAINLQTTTFVAPLISEDLTLLASQWDNIAAHAIETELSTTEMYLGTDVADDIISIIEKTVPTESEEKHDLLQKIKGKITVSDLIAILTTLITLLTYICGEISTDNREKVADQRMQVVVEENQDLRMQLKENQRYQEELIFSMQQLTDIIEGLTDLPPENLIGEQEDNNLHKINSEPDPEN